MSLWVWCTWTHYPLISSDWVYWFLFAAYNICTSPFQNGIHFLSTSAQCIWSFPLLHTQRTYWSVHVEPAFAYRENSGLRFAELRLLNHIGPVSIRSSSLNIRWPRHFTFFFLLYDEWGVRHKMLSGIFIQGSMQQQQQRKRKNRPCHQPYFPLHVRAFFFFLSLQSQTGRDRKVYLIYLFNKHFWSLKHISSFRLEQRAVFSWVCNRVGLLSSHIIHSHVFLQGLYPLDVFLMAVVGDEKVSVCLSKTAATVVLKLCFSPALALIKAEHAGRDKGRVFSWKCDIVERLMLKITTLCHPAICHRL